MKSGGDQPVRLKVAYKSPEALLGELTKSVGRGGVRIESKRSLPVGTRFVFELRTTGIRELVEVFGTVLSVSESAPGKFVLHIRYEPPKNRLGLDAVLSRIFELGAKDTKRKWPRIPLAVRGTEDKPDAPTYRLRDISRGGLGVDVEATALPHHIRVGTPFLMQMRLTTGMLAVHGEVAWAVSAWKEKNLPPRLGISFADLRPQMEELLDDLVTLRALPAPPWIAKLLFGPDAVTNMPASP